MDRLEFVKFLEFTKSESFEIIRKKNINFHIFTSIRMSEVTEEVPKETIPEVDGDSQKQEVCF